MTIPAVSGVSAANTVGYAYDLAGRITSLSDTLGNGIGNSYDALSAVLRNMQGGATIAHEVRHEIDANRAGWPTKKAEDFRTELNAYTTQADVFQGLGVISGIRSPDAIRNYAGKSAKLWCTMAAKQGLAPIGCSR